MGRRGWYTEILNSWQEAEKLRDEWNALAVVAACEHPFFRHEWFSCWYPAYVPKENVRIIVLRSSDGQLRALFPGFLKIIRIGYIKFRCFCYAANDYSLLGGIIAHPEDYEAIEQVFLEAVEQLQPSPHILILPLVHDKSGTDEVVSSRELPNLAVRLEHADYAIAFSMPDGWDDYLSKRTKKTRKRIKESLTRSRKMGGVRYEQFDLRRDSYQTIERLRLLDAKTWQGQKGTGLFSTPENEAFYSRMLSFKHTGLFVRVYFAIINGRDAAYHITVAAGSTRFILKSGYHPDFAYCRAGVLTRKYVGEHSSAEGVQRIDLGVGATEEKRRWETDRYRVVNWWLFHRGSLRSRLLAFMLSENKGLKIKRQNRLSIIVQGMLKRMLAPKDSFK